MDTKLQQILLVILASLLLVPLGVIAVVQAIADRPFNEPEGLIALAGAAVAFFFRHGSFLAAAAQTAAVQTEANRHTEAVLSGSPAASPSPTTPTPTASPGSATGTDFTTRVPQPSPTAQAPPAGG
jgi:hypothetical protein